MADHVEIAGLVERDERFRCRCQRHERERGGWPCVRRATQEDMLCDVCRPVPVEHTPGQISRGCWTAYMEDQLVSCHVDLSWTVDVLGFVS